MAEEYVADVNAGHNIVASVYVETLAFARTDGPEWLRPLGEVEFANGVAAMTAGDCTAGLESAPESSGSPTSGSGGRSGPSWIVASRPPPSGSEVSSN